MKVCTKCKEEKELSDFGKQKKAKDGLNYYCKSCVKLNDRNKSRTKIGKLKRIYDDQVQHSKNRGHEPPIYTKQEFISKYIDNLDYEKHYYSWLISNYSNDYSPSFDRKDDYKGYSFDNIQIMYWYQNKEKGDSDRKNGVNNKQSKTVVGICIKTNNKIEFHSSQEAGRNGFDYSHVSKCCLGKLKTHKGYTWKFKD